MNNIDSYRSTHAELLQMISDLRSIMNVDALRLRPTAKAAHEMLCDLGERLKMHLADEDKRIYPSLLIHEDPKVKSIAWGFISGEKPLRKTFDDYNKRWLKDCDFNFTEAFIAETDEMFDMLVHRIEREDQVLFPKLVEIGMFQEVAVGR